MENLNFITAGMPLKTEPKEYAKAFEVLSDMGLDGLELEFVRGVRMSDKSKSVVSANSKDFVVTAHGPYYINLNSQEEEKVEASITRIVDTAIMGQNVGAYSITYHAAFYMGEDKDVVYKKVVERTQKILSQLEKSGIDIWVRPETTGKATQWGDIDEIVKLSKEFKQVLPCVDFAHIHARSGGEFNTYDDFCNILEKVASIGDYAISNFHGHIAGIAYSEKGEKNHLPLIESDMNYKDLLKALKKFNVKGALVCESPNIEDDCKLLKDYYLSL
ncbi:MAG: TIM barrel protein [bacterium]|nr:TIM barrel protein [bacterium]